MPQILTQDEMSGWLDEKDPAKLAELFQKARTCAIQHVGPKVYLRGLIELGNGCSKDCYYCGIRKGNKNLGRFQMSEFEVLECAETALEAGYGSIVLQSGERQDANHVYFIEEVIRKIKRLSSHPLGITLSLGEQTTETYERWFCAGAHRYLLRIETSHPGLYAQLHPPDHSFENRLRCLRVLRELGYQVGTGIMIGLPHQTLDDLINDILFFKQEDVDMVGMGPYLPHADTPLEWPGGNYDAEDHLRLGLVMIALVRLMLPDVNIAAATALQALDPSGREKGIAAGANIIMPNITPIRYRKSYRLYDHKPCLEEDARQCSRCMESRLQAMGVEIGYGKWGDSPHFLEKQKIRQ